VQTEITRLLPTATLTSTGDLANQVGGSLPSAASLTNDLGRWMAAAALVAAFAVASLPTTAAVTRRVRELGTLKALGWSTKRIVTQVMSESAVVGVIGRRHRHRTRLRRSQLCRRRSTQAVRHHPPRRRIRRNDHRRRSAHRPRQPTRRHHSHAACRPRCPHRRVDRRLASNQTPTSRRIRPDRMTRCAQDRTLAPCLPKGAFKQLQDGPRALLGAWAGCTQERRAPGPDERSTGLLAGLRWESSAERPLLGWGGQSHTQRPGWVGSTYLRLAGKESVLLVSVPLVVPRRAVT